jgi:hypothetical protein
MLPRVQNFFVPHVAATVLWKEAVRKCVPDVVYAFDRARNVSRHFLDGLVGAISVSNSSNLPASDASMLMKPVMFPPGRGRLATNPLPTGSTTSTNTIGIVG